jgi:hypothetical protein
MGWDVYARGSAVHLEGNVERAGADLGGTGHG